MAQKAMKPQRKEDSSLGYEQWTHPAFGSITISRTSCGRGPALFGSKLRHGHVVSIEIRGADLQRDMYSEHHYPREIVCELMLSEAQWARMVASAGLGNGVPCTFNYRPAPGYQLMNVPEIDPDETMQETYARHVEEKLKEYEQGMREAVADLDALIASGKANKGQLNALRRQIGVFAEHFSTNMAYAQETMHEAMEKTVADGKSEIEAFIVQTAIKTGLQQLADNPSVSLIDDTTKVTR